MKWEKISENKEAQNEQLRNNPWEFNDASDDLDYVRKLVEDAKRQAKHITPKRRELIMPTKDRPGAGRYDSAGRECVLEGGYVNHDSDWRPDYAYTHDIDGDDMIETDKAARISTLVELSRDITGSMSNKSSAAEKETSVNMGEKNESIKFRAKTFEEARKIENPIPDALLENILVKKQKAKGLSIEDKFVDNTYERPRQVAREAREQYFKERDRFRAKWNHYIDGQESLNENMFGWDMYSTDEYVKKRNAGGKVNISKRIYLNPRQGDIFKVYDQLLQEFQDKKYAIKSKMVSGVDLNQEQADKIVIYVDDEQANDVLRSVEETYRKNGKSFIGRKSVIIGTELTDGLAVADDPADKSESATSLRNKVLREAYDKLVKVHESNKKDSEPPIWWYEPKNILPTYKRIVLKKLNEIGISTDNWSFNK